MILSVPVSAMAHRDFFCDEIPFLLLLKEKVYRIIKICDEIGLKTH